MTAALYEDAGLLLSITPEDPDRVLELLRARVPVS
jgi:hypothetical protein